jgi:hypothetical protein
MLSFLYPTKDQMISYLGTISKWIGAALLSHGVTVSPDVADVFTGPIALQFYSGIVLMVIPVLRDRFIHSNAGKLASAGSLAVGPNAQIKTIEVLPTAPPAIQAVADDSSVPGVQPAATARFDSSIKNRGI